MDRQFVNLEIRIAGAALDKRMAEQPMCAQIIDGLRAAFKIYRKKMLSGSEDGRSCPTSWSMRCPYSSSYGAAVLSRFAHL